MRFAALVLCLLCLLLPSPARCQSYSSTSSSVTYDPNTNLVTLQTEWFYGLSSNVYWYMASPVFEVAISKYTSTANYNANIAHSTNTYEYTPAQGNWSQGAYSPGVGRLYGYKQLSLADGFIYTVTLVNPKTGLSSHQVSGYAPTYFVWSGQAQSAVLVDRLNPGDGE
jgi:hypothetical protein